MDQVKLHRCNPRVSPPKPKHGLLLQHRVGYYRRGLKETKVSTTLPLGQQQITRNKAMKPGSEILVSCADRTVWIRLEGNGTSTNSTALRPFAKEMIHRGAREFIFDLSSCPAMDSTFLGTLAGISLRLRELGDGSLSVINLNERNAESLRSLGLDKLFNVRVSAVKKADKLSHHRRKTTAPLTLRRYWKLTRL